ncbi:hypothetical protein ACRE_043750 [Hapsidospora chrysogenum ATCC 11550]|uniref:Uncharacterized protein n=1 Tax=Hapsidospora chrysogenum (strain ATCC 11550 / CBS 779.69 / DSM 880 / IAM 14645 / JCM 23072 / IMI 49137) TaxID=857340 RepID=A0A086T696_HAPC1|nr:hypothetical protein ACRE_043750 [Hapsidospora chrysogenum ATCC 11550]
MRGYYDITAYRKEDSVIATRKLRGRVRPQLRRRRRRCLRFIRSIRDWFGMCWGRRDGDEVDERDRLLVGGEGVVHSEEGKWDRYYDDYSDSESDSYSDDDDDDDHDHDDHDNDNDDSTGGEDERLIGPEDVEREGVPRRNSALSLLRTATGKKGRGRRY